MNNLYALWREIFAEGPVQVGQVIAYDGGRVSLQLPGGGIRHARGQAAVGSKVYVRDGVIQAPAPDLPLDIGEV